MDRKVGRWRFRFYALLVCSLVIKLRSDKLSFYSQLGKQNFENVAHRIPQYTPSKLETEVTFHSKGKLNFDMPWVDECTLYLENLTGHLHQEYNNYVDMLDRYSKSVWLFESGIEDLRRIEEEERARQCDSLDFLTFFKSGYLSKTEGGYIEPLLPPLRHPQYCNDGRESLLNLSYLVHDFTAICKRMNATTRTVFIDLGASLEFHNTSTAPVLSLLDLYRRFGIKFDHYYAFERTTVDPGRAFDLLPDHIIPSYHWFNFAVESAVMLKRNPWSSVLSKFDSSDFVVVKLDIDDAATELSLTSQLLDRKYSTLVDQFYFEHHVKVRHMRHLGWKRTASGTLDDSISLFRRLRTNGIPAHPWV